MELSDHCKHCCLFSRAASMSLVARPSFLCVLATASDVMWPCTSVDSSSLSSTRDLSTLLHSTHACSEKKIASTIHAHFRQNIAHYLAAVVLSYIEELWPRKYVVKIVLHAVSIVSMGCTC